MDGIANAVEHARYAKSFFEVEDVPIRSIIDIGVGLGVQFREMLALFSPDRALGIDVSELALAKAGALQLDPYGRIEVELRQQGIEAWCAEAAAAVVAEDEEDMEAASFDLGVCMSVVQYIPDEVLARCLPVLAERLQYLYLTVPTAVEFERQAEALDFRDPYAIHRTQAELLALFAPHFTVISSRILESKVHFDARTTNLTDLLFRF